MDTGAGEEGECGMYEESNVETYMTICIHDHMSNRQPVGICCMTQGTQTRALKQPRGVGWERRCEGGSRGRGLPYG